MDPASKEQFKWKFYRLQVIINIVVVLLAAGIIALFLAPEAIRIPAFVLLILAAIILAFYALKRYRETKQWLEGHT
jgi:4-hydroxybenzoate polyprenyltransferase